MVTPGRRPDAALSDWLRDSARSFDFIQAVRLIQRAAQSAGAPDAETPHRIGHDGDPRRETLRLRAALELAFPSTDIVDYDASGPRPELTVTFMGLNGVSGILPEHYARAVLEAVRDKGFALRDFFDLFNHRALSLFVRAAEKYRLPLAFEAAGSGHDAITEALFGLIGLRGPALRGRQALPDHALLHFSGHFAHRPRTAGCLESMLRDYCGGPARVKQFQGRWIRLSDREQTRLGKPVAEGHSRLGRGAVLGSRVWDIQGAIRLTLGPLDYAQFRSLLPGERPLTELAALARTYIGPECSFDVQLVLKATDIPPLALAAGNAPGSRLGWNTWLPKRGTRADAADAIFKAEAT